MHVNSRLEGYLYCKTFFCIKVRALTRPYRGHLTAPSQLKLAEYFPNWVFPKFLNPINLKHKSYWFFVHTHGYKLQFDYDHSLIRILLIPSIGWVQWSRPVRFNLLSCLLRVSLHAAATSKHRLRLERT